jgi:antitoxin HicB
LQVAGEHGDPIPQSDADGESGRFIARVPRGLHTRLITRAAQEGVSMNRLVVSLLADGMGARAGNAGRERGRSGSDVGTSVPLIHLR